MEDKELIVKISDLIEKCPNDMDLGKQVRSLFINELTEKNTKDDNSSRL